MSAPDLPLTHFHLTARPVVPTGVTRGDYLARTLAVATYLATLINSSGDITSPDLPGTISNFGFVYAVATLAKAGVAGPDLLAAGIRCMDRSTYLYATTNGFPGGGYSGSDFWAQPISDSITLFQDAGAATSAQLVSWRSRMTTVYPYHNNLNWATYQIRGEWHQYLAGLISHAQAVADIERNWRSSNVTGPVASYPPEDAQWSLFQDHSSVPDTLSVEVAGRSNLLAMVHEGYDGATAPYFRDITNTGTQTALLMMDPSGQAPANGRTDDHVWIDAGYQLAFDIRAEDTTDAWVRGQYRRAANLTFRNIARWANPNGFYQITKNYFPTSWRVGYQPASSVAGYDGNLALITAQAYNTRTDAAGAESALPVEIGGYAFAMDRGFHTAFANAGGMAMEFGLQGQSASDRNTAWTPLGVVRMGRPGWDTRLGPSDGVIAVQPDGSLGVGTSFAPTWYNGSWWTRLGTHPRDYAGTFTTTFASPVLTRASVTWAPLNGYAGPTFVQDFTLTPDAILVRTTETAGAYPFGMLWPLMADFGGPALTTRIDAANGIATTVGPNGDDQNFILIGAGANIVTEGTAQSPYGNILPARGTTTDATNSTLVYPRNPSDPPALTVKDRFQITATGFTSPLGRVAGTLYTGRTAAGGYGKAIDLNRDGQADARFSAPCTFIIQLSRGVATAVEVDRPVTITLQGRTVALQAYTPIAF